MRQPRLKAPAHLGVAYYHCISRVVDRRLALGDEEREMFVHFMRLYERLCGLRVVTYCVMGNHFHLLIEVPKRPEVMPSEADLLRLIARCYGKTRAHLVGIQLLQFREAGAYDAAQTILHGWFERMWDVSAFMKTLKQRFTQWFNKRHQRRGTLWEDRFRSVLVEGAGDALAMVAAYIDLNPVRAGLVDDPKDYRWCGYAEAVAGIPVARDGLVIAASARQRGAAKAWVNKGNVLEEYRRMLFNWGVCSGSQTGEADSPPLRRGFDRAAALQELSRGARLSSGNLLQCRIRYFTDGAVIGSRMYVESIFAAVRDRFGTHRKDGARAMRGMEKDEALYSLRDLRQAAFG